ncbi:hypothetical protein E3P92_02406 [Wallemia ichthyophaga]|uniref:arginyltransferase n=1 Tax=Wallemia ichthyophaga TaxID=245174 RepID=A0A4T0GHR6_WALIC|nr:hypothetical protein E3P95_02061 [Wallemia ichthyophaga]TIB00365.1 hypothetical protein E3P94_02185 [Wallemia ichthyophaga]TIB11560.1 hypothetical protein E3P90_02363 [Wallemia ichthyophaga]TIB12884.1 hypothetical protein E3P93_02123 [Wallemia ichthyophaga]TIB12955.1 hypothetical protein E3P92_02406 [Wallemia ichthyophaga]
MLVSSRATAMEIKVLYKKQEGVLKIIESGFEFKSLNSFHVGFDRLNTLFASKAGSTPVRLKVDLLDPQQSLTFTFIHPTNALSEREAAKEQLTQAIAGNRARASSQIDRQVSGSAGTSATTSPHPGLGLSKVDLEIRKKVLVKDPQLAKLHRDLVIGGVITEDEFWQGRQQLLLLEHLSASQKPGKPSTLVDPRPTSSQAGEFTITITPQLVQDIFQEYPVVRKAFIENVPNPLAESDFWIRYFHSHLFARHRASSRVDANDARNDPVFDQYLEEADDGLEPRHAQRRVYDRLLDLGSTQADHDASGNALDITMQAGKVKAALPLMRRFNEHSQRLLSATVGDAPSVQGESGAQDNYTQQIRIDDLEHHQEAQPVRLNMKDREQYYTNMILDGEAGGASALQSDTPHMLDTAQLAHSIREGLEEWDVLVRADDIHDTTPATREIEDGLRSTAQIAAHDTGAAHVATSNAMKAAISCHTACTEFLRLYWSSKLSQPRDTGKVDRMVDFIRKTPSKVDAVVKKAQTVHEADVLRQALQPVLNGVKKVLANEQQSFFCCCIISIHLPFPVAISTTMSSIIVPIGYSGSSCGYCGGDGQRSEKEENYSYGFWAVQMACEDYRQLIDSGWRRSGGYIYNPDRTRTCCPQYTIKLDAAAFKPQRSLRQELHRFNRWIRFGGDLQGGDTAAATTTPTAAPKDKHKGKNTTFDLLECVKESQHDNHANHNLEVSLERAGYTDEKFELFKAYQVSIHHETISEQRKDSFKRFLVDGPLKYSPITYKHGRPVSMPSHYGQYHHVYRVDGKLIAMGVLDILPECVSSVYLMYHPGYQSLNLGKISALFEVALALEMRNAGAGAVDLYMGYYIHDCVKMKYKATYQPSYLLDAESNTFYPFTQAAAILDKHKNASFERGVSIKVDGGSTPGETHSVTDSDDGSYSEDDDNLPSPPPAGFLNPRALPKQLLNQIKILDNRSMRLLTYFTLPHSYRSQVDDLVAALGDKSPNFVILIT